MQFSIPPMPTFDRASASPTGNLSMKPAPIGYVIITPVRDEEKFVEGTIKAVIGQTVRPMEWVIVDDGSTDHTGEIIDDYASRIPWIHAVHRKNRGHRKSGGGVIEAFYDGYNALQNRSWDFVVKLDGDLTFAHDYFEKIFNRFDEQQDLGVAGGIISNAVDGTLRLEAGPRFHVRGATKIYRRQCWEAIEGLHLAPGWDTIDEVKANMFGWRSQTFPELQLQQHRPTGTADGWWKDRAKNGRAYYVAGYHPLFFAAKFFYRMSKPPYVVGAVAMGCGFLSGYFGAAKRINDPRLVKYLRHQQINRLLGRKTVWR